MDQNNYWKAVVLIVDKQAILRRDRFERQLVYIWNKYDFYHSLSGPLIKSFNERRNALIFEHLMGFYKGLTMCDDYNIEEGDDVLFLCEFIRGLTNEKL